MDWCFLFSSIKKVHGTGALNCIHRPRASVVSKMTRNKNKLICYLAQEVSEVSVFQLLTQIKGDRKATWYGGITEEGKKHRKEQSEIFWKHPRCLGETAKSSWHNTSQQSDLCWAFIKDKEIISVNKSLFCSQAGNQPMSPQDLSTYTTRRTESKRVHLLNINKHKIKI